MCAGTVQGTAAVAEHEAGYGLVLEFDRDSHDFALGVEVGRLWEQLETGEAFEQEIHACNVEMAMRMREATGREICVEDTTDENWCLLIVEDRA